MPGTWVLVTKLLYLSMFLSFASDSCLNSHLPRATKRKKKTKEKPAQELSYGVTYQPYPGTWDMDAERLGGEAIKRRADHRTLVLGLEPHLGGHSPKPGLTCVTIHKYIRW